MSARDAAAPGLGTEGGSNTYDDASNVNGHLNRRRRAHQYAAAFERSRPEPRTDPRVDAPITPHLVHSWRVAVMHLRDHGHDVVWAVPGPILAAAQQEAA